MIKIQIPSESTSKKISIILQFDFVDMAIISIFQISGKSRTASQIRSVLDFYGIPVSSAFLREKLRRLVTLNVLSSEKGTRVARYTLKLFNSSYAH